MKLTAFNLHLAPFSIHKKYEPICGIVALLLAWTEFITISQLVPDIFAKYVGLVEGIPCE